jgi:hypothetical protein
MSAFRQSTDPLKAKAKQRRFLKSQKAGYDYLSSKHEFELTHNSDGTGETVIMSGRESKLINEVFRSEFIQAIAKGGYTKETRPILKHWKCIMRDIDKPKP